MVWPCLTALPATIPPPSTNKNCLSTGWLRQPTYYSAILCSTLWLCPLVYNDAATTTLQCRRLQEHGGWISGMALPYGPACRDPPPPSTSKNCLSTGWLRQPTYYSTVLSATLWLCPLVNRVVDTVTMHCRRLQEQGGWVSGLALPYGPACHDPPSKYQQELLVYRVATTTYLLLCYTMLYTMAMPFGLQ